MEAPQSELPNLRLPHHHDVRPCDVMLPRLHATLAAIRELDHQARALERAAAAGQFLRSERARSGQYGGRSVFGVERPQ